MSTAASSNTAPVKWAQRSDSLYLTIALPDVKDETIELLDESLSFKGTSGSQVYEVHFEFFKAVDAEGSTYKVLPRSIQMLLKKKIVTKATDGTTGDDNDDDDTKFWPRLLKDKALEKNQVKIDWDRYVEEDDEEEGFDTSNLDGGMGMGRGMGGMGGGMGGMGGGMGGMDMEALMKSMGGMGAMGGMGGPDMADYDDDDDNDDDDGNNDNETGDDGAAPPAGGGDDADDLPELEEVN